MAKITYTLLDRAYNSIPENENYSSADLNLIDNYQINKNYSSDLHYIESHFYSLNNEKIFSVYDYNITSDVETDAEGKVSNITLEPEVLSAENGFSGVDHKIVFHFLNDLYTSNSEKQNFYISSISQDRSEILLHSEDIDVNKLINTTEDLKENISSKDYYDEYWLNLGNNDLFIITNIDVYETDDKYTIALKLYEPLPASFEIKQEVQVVEKVSDSVVVEVQVDVEEDPEVFPTLREANFDIDLDLNSTTPTEYFNYDELFSFSNLNSNREIFSYLKEKSVEINIDYSDYDNFINFSSATERLKNFKYKVQLIQTYQASKDQLVNTTNSSGSEAKYDNLIKGVVDNFDHYERYLYYESGSHAWPKSTTNKPHINLNTTESEASAWYSSQLISASNYDTSNYDVLTNTIPSYIAEDNNNNSALLFVHMIGQHFDNLWVYTKATTDKYDNDNRLNVGISKDLVKDALTSFGTKLYNSIEGSNDLFKYLVADTYDSGSSEEVVNTFTTVPGVSADAQPISRKNYEGELYKRIYHNLPYLMKTKGTERGLRALINCFGIPSDYLTIKEYGGEEVDSSKFVGYENTSNNKVRYETRISGSVGKVLTKDKSIQKTEVQRTQDIHRVEVGFSPADSINTYILSQLSATFDLDDYIGDPRDLHKSSYSDLFKLANSTLHNNVERTQLNDFVRVLKFYDNVLFKMIKDFIPAKATLDTGIIIKPHILNRSKIKSPIATGTREEYTGSIETAFTTGSQAGVYDDRSISYSTSHSLEIRTMTGSVLKPIIDESPMLNGELDGAHIEITDGELNDENIFKQVNVPFINYDIVKRDAGSGANYNPFNLSTQNTSSVAEDACLGGFNTFQTLYHDGEAEIPAVGDYVFPTIDSATGFDGQGNWWIAKDSNNNTFALRISGSGAKIGYVGTRTDCSTFDNTPPAGYSATWNMVPQNILNNNKSAVPFKIFGAEIGTTYNVTASLESAPNTKATKTGTITGTGAAGQLTDFESTLDCTSLSDGANVLLDITLVDGAGNRGGLAPTGPLGGSTLTASLKDTVVPSGYTARFVTSNFSTDQTVNDDGVFRIKVESIPNNDTGVIYYTLSSTGGGTYSSSTTYDTTGPGTSKNITVTSFQAQNLNNGTVSLTLRLRDTAGNEGAAATDSVTYTQVSGTMTVSGITDSTDLSYYAQSFTFSVNMTPNNASYTISDNQPWISVSGYSGTGDDSSVTATVTQNYGSFRLGTITLKAAGSGTTLDTIPVGQNAQCVAPSTLILMADGTLKKAGDLQIGDIVRTKHERSLEEVVAPVTEKSIYTNERVKVTIGDKEIVCSQKHRFYVDNKSDFVHADELEKGDILSGKEFISREEYSAGEVVKITIENAATYISEGILSHNIK